MMGPCPGLGAGATAAPNSFSRERCPVAFRPRKKTMRQAKYTRCKRCGGQVRRHIARCKKCSEKQG